MKMKRYLVLSSVFLAQIWCLLFNSGKARAAIDNHNLLDSILQQYSTAASSWGVTITGYATWLFWTLAVISMVWTFGMMALRQADLAEFFGEFIRFTIFTGFFWWLLVNGPNFALSIMDSLRTIGGRATGTGANLTPSGIADIGFDIFFRMLEKSSVWSPVDSAAGIIMSAIILVILALIGVNMLLLLISGWILAYAGVFFLGFGGSRWTSEMAVAYFKTALSIGAQLFTMVLLVGIGKSFIDQYYGNMDTGMSLKELGVMLIVAVVLFELITKVPSLIGQLAMGGGAYALGGGFGAGAFLGAVATGTAALAAARGGAVSAAANVTGAGQALMAAFRKASAAGDGGDGMSELPAAAGVASGGGGNAGGGSPLATAMGDGGDGGGEGADSGGLAAAMAGVVPAADRDSSGAKTGARQAGKRVANSVKIAAGTIANLGQGAYDLTKAKFRERTVQTLGSQTAQAIKGGAGQGKATESAAEEVAEFVNREANTS